MWSVGTKVKLGVGITLIILLVNALLSYAATRMLISDDESVRHTYRVISELDVTLSTLKDAETGERGYLITGSSEYLEPYEAAISQIDQHLQNLTELSRDNPKRGAEMPGFEHLVRRRLAGLKQGIDLLKSGDREGARQLILSGIGKQMMDEIRGTVNRMEAEENDLLAQRAEESRQSQRNLILTFLLANIVACGVLLLTATVTVNGIKARQRAEDELREQRQRAEAANNAKDQFLAVLSHELRTPLTAVFGWVQLLQGEVDEATKQKALEVINRNVRAQNQLIDDLLNISQIIAGKLQITPELVDPLQVVNRSIETARPSASARHLTLSLESDPNVPVVSADPARLQQIVSNILTNAIKFTPNGGTITVQIRRAQAELLIIISDTGQGISPEFLPHVFNRFSQADASTTRTHGGLGLGLALVRQLVEMHRGRVEAKSSGLGKGSTFTVALPLPGEIDSFKTPKTSKKHSPAGAALAGIEVLLVEDDQDAREVIAHALRQSAASVIEADSGATALSHLNRSKPDVLISDIAMPGMDGYQLIVNVRDRLSKTLPAIAVTAYANPADRERAFQAGFHSYMPKPIDVTELISLVGELARRQS